MLISDKVDLKPKLAEEVKEGHCIFINRKIHQKVISMLNIYTPSRGVPDFIK